MCCFLHPHHRKVTLDPAPVTHEVQLLQRLCSTGIKRPLKSLRYTSGLNHLLISLGLRGKQLLLTLMLDIPKYKKKSVFGRHQKAWKSLYLSDSSSKSRFVFCFIVENSSCLNKAFSSVRAPGASISICLLFSTRADVFCEDPFPSSSKI